IGGQQHQWRARLRAGDRALRADRLLQSLRESASGVEHVAFESCSFSLSIGSPKCRDQQTRHRPLCCDRCHPHDVPHNPEMNFPRNTKRFPKKPQPAIAASWGKSLPGSPLPVSLGVPQKRERGAAQVRTDELLGTLMGMGKGNNTVKVLETDECRDGLRLSAEPGLLVF